MSKKALKATNWKRGPHLITKRSAYDLYRHMVEAILQDGFGMLDRQADLDGVWYYDPRPNVETFSMRELALRCTHPLEDLNEFNLSLTGFYLPGRYEKLLRDYLDPESFTDFFEEAFHHTSSPYREISYSCPVKSNHTQGNCLLGFTLRDGNGAGKPQLTVYSRSSLFPQVFGLDLGLGVAICRALVDEGFDPEIELVWHISHMMGFNWIMLPVLQMMGLREEVNIYANAGCSMAQWAQPYMSPITFYDQPVPKFNVFKRGWDRLRDFHERGSIESGHEFYHLPYLPLEYYKVWG